MANPTTTVSEYCQVLTKSRLIAAAEVASLHQQWHASSGNDADIDGFRKSLVNQRFLTDYQAALVQRGHSDGFYIGGYVILDRIGKGQTAGVYKAVHTSGQVVALKVLPNSKARNPHVLARFQREGRLLTQLSHPNTVRAFQVVSPSDGNGVHFIVLEYLEGETLDDVLTRRKKLAPAEAARLIFQALQGLQHLHEQRMVHRDLKPANIMLSPSSTETTLDTTVKILDIGLARELFDENADTSQQVQLTVEGAVLGTPDYLAPEQARDARTADIRADIYSLGCVLYHCLAGRPPFLDKNVMSIMVKHATEEPQPILQLNPSVPAGLQVVLNTMLAKDVIARYQTPAMAADALRPFVPSNSKVAVPSSILPGFENWLSSESIEQPMPNKPRPTSPTSSASSATPTAAPTPMIRLNDDIVEAPQSAPMPSASMRAAMAGPPSAKVRVGGAPSAGVTAIPTKVRAEAPPPPAPPKVRTTMSGPPSGKIKMGTGLAAALANATATPAAPIPSALKPPSVPSRPSPLPCGAWCGAEWRVRRGTCVASAGCVSGGFGGKQPHRPSAGAAAVRPRPTRFHHVVDRCRRRDGRDRLWPVDGEVESRQDSRRTNWRRAGRLVSIARRIPIGWWKWRESVGIRSELSIEPDIEQAGVIA
jgi:eukaryotic-like serine/threonine-protein kinase